MGILLVSSSPGPGRPKAFFSGGVLPGRKACRVLLSSSICVLSLGKLRTSLHLLFLKCLQLDNLPRFGKAHSVLPQHKAGRWSRVAASEDIY